MRQTDCRRHDPATPQALTSRSTCQARQSDLEYPLFSDLFIDSRPLVNYTKLLEDGRVEDLLIAGHDVGWRLLGLVLFIANTRGRQSSATSRRWRELDTEELSARERLQK